MRIILAGPPKTGNVWVENILATVYELKTIENPPSYDFWEKRDVNLLREFVQRGQFADNSIFHQHYWPTDQFLLLAATIPCHLITVIRDPYDTFVSLYHYIQNFADSFRAVNDPGVMVIGKPISHPSVLEFLRSSYKVHLQQANSWVQDGRSVVVRYEDLHHDAVATVRRVTQRLLSVSDEKIIQALSESTASKMRRRSHWMSLHVRSAKEGDWRHELGSEHLEIFRSHFAELVRGLGYSLH